MFNELIKNYEKIREYMRDFYVYGFKSRDEYNEKSLRSYDDEKRRIESYLGEHMRFVRTLEGKNMYIDIDTRHISTNPLYKSLKSKSFTDKDITLHFIIFDILYSPDVAFSVTEIADIIADEYLSHFDEPLSFDESTIRKKLKEYEKKGIIEVFKEGKTNYYKRTSDIEYAKYENALRYFSEIAPVGAIGSFILDKLDTQSGIFAFKHHYITSALDSDVLSTIFEAINQRKILYICNHTLKKENPFINKVVPLQVFASVQGGREHLLCYDLKNKNLTSFRIDYIKDIKIGEECPNFDEFRESLEEAKKHMWGVVVRKRTEHISFTVEINNDEYYIVNRLNREKRIGTVEKIDDHHYRFSAEVCDSWELVPWIRTFICRICEINFLNPIHQKRFMADFKKMYELYNRM